MPHQNFVNTIPSTKYDDGVPLHVVDGRKAVETCTGTRRVKPGGWIPPLPYSFYRNFYQRHMGRAQYSYHINNGAEVFQDNLTGCIGVGTGTSIESLYLMSQVYEETGIPQSWIDRAVTKARMTMKDQDVNLGVAFAERNKTAKLLGDTATTLAESALLLMQRKWRRAAQRLGISNPRKPRGHTVPQRWLELQYGWEPLLSDVHGAVDALAKRDKSDWIVTGKGFVKEPIKVSDYFGNPTAAAYGYGKASGTKGVFVRIDAIPQNDMLAAARSLGLTNPASIAWELVPFSFVVDWALPVGQYLDSLDAMLGYGPTWCSISKFERFNVSHDLRSSSWTTKSGASTYYHSRHRSGTAHREYVSLNRSVSTTVPLPLLPRFKDPSSLEHMANGLSLLATVFKGRH